MSWDAEQHVHDVPVDGCMGRQPDATENSRRSCAAKTGRRDVVGSTGTDKGRCNGAPTAP